MPDMMRTTAAALLAALLATGVHAQAAGEAPEQPPAGADAAETGEADPAPTGEALGLSMGEEASEVGQTYVKEEHGDWEVRCVRSDTGSDPCQLYQLLDDQTGNSVAEISVFSLPPGGEAVAGATIITPLQTLLTAQVALQVDSGEVKRYPFRFCSSIGCYSQIGLTANEVAGFRRGAKAMLTIVPMVAPDQTVDLAISLSGFTAGYDAVTAANTAALEAARRQQEQEQGAQQEGEQPPAQQ